MQAEAVARLLPPAEWIDAAGAAGAPAGLVSTLGAGLSRVWEGSQAGGAGAGCQGPAQGAAEAQPCSSAIRPQPLSQLSAPLSSRSCRGAEADGPRPGAEGRRAAGAGASAGRGGGASMLTALKGDAGTCAPCCTSDTRCAGGGLAEAEGSVPPPVVAARRTLPVVATRRGGGDEAVGGPVAAAGCCTLGGCGCHGCCSGCWVWGVHSPAVQGGGWREVRNGLGVRAAAGLRGLTASSRLSHVAEQGG